MVRVRSDDEDETASTAQLPLHKRIARLYQAHQRKQAGLPEHLFNDRREKAWQEKKWS